MQGLPARSGLTMDACPFCDIARGEAQAHRVFEDEDLTSQRLLDGGATTAAAEELISAAELIRAQL